MNEPLLDDLAEIVQTLRDISAGNLQHNLAPPNGPEHPLGDLTRAINSVVEAWRSAEIKARTNKNELLDKLATIEAQAAAIRELSTPILEVASDVLLLPIVGALDQRRNADILEYLLERIRDSGAHAVIIDMTGVNFVDTMTASHLVKIVRATRLLGAHAVLTGVSPSIAQTMVSLQADLSEVETLSTLKAGLARFLTRD